MRCLVTAGPTFESLDQVRRLTNFSTGRLGAELAQFLVAAGHQVVLLRGEQATWPAPLASERLQVVPFTNTNDLAKRLQELAGAAMDAVFHAAAVSDFRFGQVFRRGPQGEFTSVQAGKLETRDGPLLAELVPTPKLLPRLREWFPSARVVGWKYEVDGDRAQALSRAIRQLDEARSDGCVLNGPACGSGYALVTRNATTHLATRQGLFSALLRIVG